MRINQVWIIMNNGICPIHILYSGKELEENLFAAFVRALFSFSKDMSGGEKSISSMTLGDMDIHYLAEKDEKFFVAISAEVGINQDDVDLYLKYISKLFLQYYPDYIEKLPPFEPESFVLFQNAIDFFIQFNENKFMNEIEGKKDINLGMVIQNIQFSNDNVVIQCVDDQILRVFVKSSLEVDGTFYPENGSIKLFSIQKNNNYLIILSETNNLTIIPFSNESNNQFITEISNDANLTWLTIHPQKPLVFFGDKRTIYVYNILTREQNKFKSPEDIDQFFINEKDLIFLKASNSIIYSTSLPLKQELILNSFAIKDKVYSINQGPADSIITVCLNQLIHIWDGLDNFKSLRERYPSSTSISYSEINRLIFLITEYNEFLIYDSNDASLLVNYNLVETGMGAFVSENDHLVIVYKNGLLKWFLGNINREEIAKLRSFLTKRVEHVENNIIRIHSSVQKIVANLNNKSRSSIMLKNDLNQVKVFKQQLKKLIDDKLIERTSILRDLYFKVLGYQNQVHSLIKLIENLEEEVEQSFKKSKNNELSGKTPRERIEEYLNFMKPRDQIGLGTLSDNLQLPYEDCLNHLKTMESRGLLPGFLTRGSALSIKDNVIFVKKDPKFEETGITSF